MRDPLSFWWTALLSPLNCVEYIFSDGGMIVSSVSFKGSRLRCGVCLDRSLFEGAFEGDLSEVHAFDSVSMLVSRSLSLRTSAGIFLRLERTTTRLLCSEGLGWFSVAYLIWKGLITHLPYLIFGVMSPLSLDFGGVPSDVEPPSSKSKSVSLNRENESYSGSLIFHDPSWSAVGLACWNEGMLSRTI